MKIAFLKTVDLHFMKRYLCMAAAIHFGLFLFSILGNITQQQDAVKELFTEIPLGKALVIYAQYHTLVVLSYLLKLQPIIVTASLMATSAS